MSVCHVQKRVEARYRNLKKQYTIEKAMYNWESNMQLKKQCTIEKAIYNWKSNVQLKKQLYIAFAIVHWFCDCTLLFQLYIPFSIVYSFFNCTLPFQLYIAFSIVHCFFNCTLPFQLYIAFSISGDGGGARVFQTGNLVCAAFWHARNCCSYRASWGEAIKIWVFHWVIIPLQKTIFDGTRRINLL